PQRLPVCRKVPDPASPMQYQVYLQGRYELPSCKPKKTTIDLKELQKRDLKKITDTDVINSGQHAKTVHETRSRTHATSAETRKQKAEAKASEGGQAAKKTKTENDNDNNGYANGAQIAAEFDAFCKALKEKLSVDQMREILEANAQDSSGPDDYVIAQCQDLLFYGPLEKCPFCNGPVTYDDGSYTCKGDYSEWSTCIYTTTDPTRREEQIKLPRSIQSSPASDSSITFLSQSSCAVKLIKSCQDPKRRPNRRNLGDKSRILRGIIVSLAGRLSRKHLTSTSLICVELLETSDRESWGTSAKCLVASRVQLKQGGMSKTSKALERGIPIVREQWLIDSILEREAKPLEAYDISSEFSESGKDLTWESEEARESLTAEIKLYGKRGVHKDSRLQEEGGEILEKDGILYNCAFTLCDQEKGVNDYCIMQLIRTPDGLYLYYKKGRVGDDAEPDERVDEYKKEADRAIKDFITMFEDVTGNEFEPWEREKKFQKKPSKFYPVDMDKGIDARHGALGLRQQGDAVAHCKLDPQVANFMKVLCSQDVYRYAMFEMEHDIHDLPMGMLTEVHLKRCEEVLLEHIEKLRSMKETDEKADVVWYDFSQRWFTLMPSTGPFILGDYQDLADHAAAAAESARDITVASHLIGDMTGATVDDPLFDRYMKLGCSISPLEKGSDHDMIVNYLEKTYEPYKVEDVSFGVSVERIFSVDVAAGPSYDEIKKLPNKVLLWCGTRTSKLLRHLHKGFLPAICALPVPGYMFGRAIVCSDAAAEAARYGFTAVGRTEGFLVLAVVSLGDKMTELKIPPQDTKSLEEKKMGVKGLGGKKPDESEHRVWKDDIKVPCGRLVSSGHEDSPLEYNEYAVYDPKQVSIRFLVQVTFEPQNVRVIEPRD
ncbi:Poly(ADP-ribose) polymerase, catalytic domain, partial [Dillenia turbinata]